MCDRLRGDGVGILIVAMYVMVIHFGEEKVMNMTTMYAWSDDKAVVVVVMVARGDMSGGASGWSTRDLGANASQIYS